MLSPLERNQFLKIYIFASSQNRAPTNGNSNILENRFFALLRNRALTIGKEPIIEIPCFRNLINRALTNGNNNILENRSFAILRIRTLTNGNSNILDNLGFRNLRNSALANGNNNILENDCFAILKFVSSPMEIPIFLKIINFTLQHELPCCILQNRFVTNSESTNSAFRVASVTAKRVLMDVEKRALTNG